ncbi:MAG TPA: TraR/DksA family transcriptional regulator [Candidatus Angelobacter sp.]|nr:TraR/DksA family transcriptional regulator [Candidatus Angelobacter sp.]
MTKEQLKAFERQLMEKRRMMTANRENADEDPNPEYGRDEGDRAVASQAKEMNWLLSAQERGLLGLIDAALTRIREETFGECQHCGGEVGLKRLNAIPWTQYCIACQELIEQYGR